MDLLSRRKKNPNKDRDGWKCCCNKMINNRFAVFVMLNYIQLSFIWGFAAGCTVFAPMESLRPKTQRDLCPDSPPSCTQLICLISPATWWIRPHSARSAFGRFGFNPWIWLPFDGQSNKLLHCYLLLLFLNSSGHIHSCGVIILCIYQLQPNFKCKILIFSSKKERLH